MLPLPLLALLGLLARAKVALCTPKECFHEVATEGEDIVLSPRTGIKGDEISFKKEGNIVAEWDSEFTYYPPLVDRAILDIDSGNLTIRNLSQVDAGNYKEEITVNGVVHTTCFNLEIQVPLEPPDLHCMVVNGSISINCTSVVQDSQLKYELKYAKLENIYSFEQSAIELKNTKHSGNITCVITLRNSNASSSINLSNCVSKGILWKTEEEEEEEEQHRGEKKPLQTRKRNGLTVLLVLLLLLLLAVVGVGIFFYRRRGHSKAYVPTQTPGNSANEEALAEHLNADNRDETENSGQNN